MPIGSKNINFAINILSKIVYYAMILYIAVITSNVFWWIFAPDNPKIDYTPVSAKTFDNAEKFIVNRSPFGVAIESKPIVEVKPTIVSLIKITGVYVNDEKNSFVFYKLNGKNNLAKIGDKLDNAIIKSINSNGIVINENDHDFNVSLVNETNSNSNSNNNYYSPNNNDYNKSNGYKTQSGNYNSRFNNKSNNFNPALRNNDGAESLNNNISNTNSSVNNKVNDEEFNRKKDQLIQEFVNYKESKSK
jgi:hypothetical protein